MGYHQSAFSRQSALTAAIRLAQRGYAEDPRNWTNTLDLALYRLAAGDAEQAEHLYREALAGGASANHVREAIRDLDEFLTLFPDHPQAQAMRDLLQNRLEEMDS